MKEETKGSKIKLKFVTEIRDGSRKETVAFESNGLYYEKGKSTYLSFQEPNEQGEVRVIVKITDDEVFIMRSGVISMRQTYRKGEWTQGTYNSAIGEFLLKTKTNNVTFNWCNKKKKGKFFFTYQLVIQEQEAGRYAITIDFKEDKNE